MLSRGVRLTTNSITFQNQALTLIDFDRKIEDLCKNMTPTIFQILDCTFTTIKRDILMCMAYALNEHESITVLYLCGLALDDDDVDALYKRGAFDNLIYLDLSGNRITDRGAKILYNVLSSHYHLRFIEVSGNPIGVEGTDALNRTTAIRDDLPICLDPYVIDSNENIHIVSSDQSITFQNQALEVDDFDRLIKDSCDRTKPVIFQILDCTFASMKSYIIGCMVSALNEHESITILNLCGLALTDDDVDYLFHWGAFYNLTQLDLSRNNITDKGAKILSNVLRTHHHLRSIEVGGNPIGFDGIEALRAAAAGEMCISFHIDESSDQDLIMFQNMELTRSEFLATADARETPTIISLTNCIFPTGKRYFLETMTDVLHRKKSIDTLILSGLGLDDMDVKYLCDHEAFTHLIGLNLSNNNIGYEGSKALCEVLKRYPKLCRICLESNPINEATIIALKTVIKSTNPLLSLDLGDDQSLYATNTREKSLDLGDDQSLYATNTREKNIGMDISPPAANDTNLDDRLCQICYVEERSYVLVSCGHTICETCMNRMKKDKNCPFCRAEITSRMRIFL